MKVKRKNQVGQIDPASIEAEVVRSVTETLPQIIHQAVSAATQTSVKRKSQNGITEPVAGGKCHEIWLELDKMNASGKELTLTAIAGLAKTKGWNANNTRIEFYNWRRFNGLGKRPAKTERRKADRRLHGRQQEVRAAA